MAASFPLHTQRATAARAADYIDWAVGEEGVSLPERVVCWARALIERASGTDPRNAPGLAWSELSKEVPESARWLVEVLDLDHREQELLWLTAAIELEPNLRVDLAHLAGRVEWTYLNRALVARLTGAAPLAVAYSGALFRWRLVEERGVGPQDPSCVHVDPFALSMLLGKVEGDAELAGRIHAIPAVRPLDSWPVEKTTKAVLRATRNAPVRILVRGTSGAGRRSFSGCVAERVGMPAYFIESEGVDDEEFADFYLRVQRQALVLGHAVVWSQDYLRRRVPSLPALVPLSFVLGDSVSTVPASSSTVDDAVTLEAPEGDELDALWRRFLPASVAWESREQQSVFRQYRVHVGDLVDLGRRELTEVHEVRAACRAITRGRLGDYAEVLECPFSRSDLVVPGALGSSLDDFLYEARHRREFWQRSQARRLFPRGRGIVGLFSGPPGTGKTMAAQVVASELGLDLLRIDLAKVVSKYIGETAKNLSRVFSQVREMNAVLFFDEADSLFAQRTEVKDSHDRYANSDTNYLLQHLEEFDGVALLATNRRSNIDRAFVRRLRYVLEFSRPTAMERQLMFERLLGELVENPADDLLEPGARVLGECFDVSGAQIKLAILSAVFSAGRAAQTVRVEHVLHGIQRELNKEGRQLVTADWTRAKRAMGGQHGR